MCRLNFFVGEKQKYMSRINAEEELQRQIQPHTVRNMTVSVTEGVLDAIAMGMIPLNTVVTYFISDYVNNSFLIGLLPTLQSACNAIVQILLGEKLRGRERFKPLCNLGTFLFRCAWLIISILILFFNRMQPIGFVCVFYAIYCFNGLCQGITSLTYTQMMNKVIPNRVKGRFFGVRGALNSAAGIIGAQIGGAVIASQYLGHRDRKKACEASSQLMVVTAVCALLFTVLSLAARKPLLSLLFGQIDADVMDAALTYLTVSALSFPFLASFNSSSALFRAMNDSRTPTVVSLGMNVMNLIGNSILIFGMKWGVAGAAISTLLSRVMAAVVMFILSLNKHRQLYVRLDQMTRFQPTLIGQILYIGIPSGIENGIFELGRIVVVSMISTFGTVQIAANAVANNLDGLGVLAGAAMNLAILTVVGRCVGAHDNDQVRYYTRKLLKIEYAMMAVVNVVLLAALPLILNLYTLSPASRELATQLIFIHDGFAMLLWPLALSMPNALRAANDVKFTMVLSIGSMVCFRIALSYVVGVKMGYGALGVWFAMLVDWAVRAAVYTWRFEKGKWESMARI